MYYIVYYNYLNIMILSDSTKYNNIILLYTKVVEMVRS